MNSKRAVIGFTGLGLSLFGIFTAMMMILGVPFEIAVFSLGITFGFAGVMVAVIFAIISWVESGDR